MEINQTKREKFMEYAGKRVNNVLHDMQILEPMARSASYDFTRQDVEEMFDAMQETLNNVKAEFEKKFEEKARSEKKVFTFGRSATITDTAIEQASPIAVEAATEAVTAIEESEPLVATVAESVTVTDDSTVVAEDVVEDTF